MQARAHTAKQDAIEAIERLPDDVAFDEILYRLYLLGKIEQGIQEIDAAQTISGENLSREIEQW